LVGGYISDSHRGIMLEKQKKR